MCTAMPANRDDLGTWLVTDYFAQLTVLLDSSMTYLHTTQNWCITTLLGGAIFVLSRQTFPDQTSAFISILLLVATLHFAIRSAKAYVNVMRYSTLQKHILNFVLQSGDALTEKQLIASVHMHHYGWVCPLKRRHIATKILFELGFAYFGGIVVALCAVTLVANPLEWHTWLAIGVASVAIAIEVLFGVVRSPYFRVVSPDALAVQQR